MNLGGRRAVRQGQTPHLAGQSRQAAAADGQRESPAAGPEDRAARQSGHPHRPALVWIDAERTAQAQRRGAGLELQRHRRRGDPETRRGALEGGQLRRVGLRRSAQTLPGAVTAEAGRQPGLQTRGAVAERAAQGRGDPGQAQRARRRVVRQQRQPWRRGQGARTAPAEIVRHRCRPHRGQGRAAYAGGTDVKGRPGLAGELQRLDPAVGSAVEGGGEVGLSDCRAGSRQATGEVRAQGHWTVRPPTRQVGIGGLAAQGQPRAARRQAAGERRGRRKVEVEAQPFATGTRG